MRKCNVCGQPARYWLYIEVTIFDLVENDRDRTKGLRLHLCERCEVNNRHFLQQDADQLHRIAAAITPQWRAERIVPPRARGASTQEA